MKQWLSVYYTEKKEVIYLGDLRVVECVTLLRILFGV